VTKFSLLSFCFLGQFLAPVLTPIAPAALLPFPSLVAWCLFSPLLVPRFPDSPLQPGLEILTCTCPSHSTVPRFPDSDTFESEYQPESMDGVSSLHQVLRPHLLRRVIKEVSEPLGHTGVCRHRCMQAHGCLLLAIPIHQALVSRICHAHVCKSCAMHVVMPMHACGW
jgi:hypothetical protein